MASFKIPDEKVDTHTKLAEAWKHFSERIENVNRVIHNLTEAHRNSQLFKK